MYNQTFIAPRDYLWPIQTGAFRVNTNLVQNPGW
ncbi:RagB/SusD family nutrient uptake outer membrane protein [Pedobacter sp. UBA5917]